MYSTRAQRLNVMEFIMNIIICAQPAFPQFTQKHSYLLSIDLSLKIDIDSWLHCQQRLEWMLV